MIEVNAAYRFRTGYRVVVSPPAYFQGELQVGVRQPDIRLDPKSIRLDDNGLPFTYPGVAYLPVSLLSHKLVLKRDGEYSTFSEELIKVVPKKRKKRKKK